PRRTAGRPQVTRAAGAALNAQLGPPLTPFRRQEGNWPCVERVREYTPPLPSKAGSVDLQTLVKGSTWRNDSGSADWCCLPSSSWHATSPGPAARPPPSTRCWNG